MDDPIDQAEELLIDPDMLSVAEAAHRLGVQPDAVRKRLQRGSLSGIKVDGVWLVHAALVPSEPSPSQERIVRDNPNKPPRIDLDNSTPAIPPALAMIRDEWLAPLMERNENLAREIGRMEAERDEARREADQMRTALNDLESIVNSKSAAAEPETTHGEPSGAPESVNEGPGPGETISVTPRGWRERVAAWLRGR